MQVKNLISGAGALFAGMGSLFMPWQNRKAEYLSKAEKLGKEAQTRAKLEGCEVLEALDKIIVERFWGMGLGLGLFITSWVVVLTVRNEVSEWILGLILLAPMVGLLGCTIYGEKEGLK